MTLGSIHLTEYRKRSSEARAAVPLCPSFSRRERGFSLIEMIVVMAITVILLGLIFGPIISSFNFVARGEQTSEAQESARAVLQEVVREVKDAIAVGVSEGDVLRLPQSDTAQLRTVGVAYPGYINVYDETGKVWPANYAMIDYLPADDTLQLHGGHLSNPPIPQRTNDPSDPNYATHTHEKGDGTTVEVKGVHNVIVRYFVGLSDPGYPHSNPNDRYSARSSKNPAWFNSHLSNDLITGGNVDNTYVLYRIEFDPDDPAYSNWVMNDPNYNGQGTPPLVVNPDFFYDGTTAPNGVPFWVNWRRNARPVTSQKNIDLIRFNRDNAGIVQQAQSTVTFTPTVVLHDSALPAASQQGSPLTYVTSHGNWTGVQNGGGNLRAGQYPHIMVYEPTGDTNGPSGLGSLRPVYNNWDTASKAASYPGNSRVLSWDSRTGTIHFEAGRGVGGTQAITVEKPLSPSDNGWEFDPVALAVANNGPLNGLPTSLQANLRVIPTVQVTYSFPSSTGRESVDPNAPLQVVTDTYRLSTDNRMMDTPPQPANWGAGKGIYPTTLPAPGTFVLDSQNGHVIMGFPYPGPNNPQRPQPIPEQLYNQPVKVRFSFTYQTNTPNDIVSVDYATKSLINVSMGMRMFDPSTSRPILVQLTDKVALRNTGR